jgi:hypothetical protein
VDANPCAWNLDVNVLAIAEAENQILLTFDRDFGELAFRAGLPAMCGIILFRLRMTMPTHSNLSHYYFMHYRIFLFINVPHLYFFGGLGAGFLRGTVTVADFVVVLPELSLTE